MIQFDVTFENSEGKERTIGNFSIDNSEYYTMSEAQKMHLLAGCKEANKIINDFLNEHNYKSYYSRYCFINENTIQIDVGSYSEFFYYRKIEKGE